MPRRPAPVLPLRRRVESCKGVQQATAAVGKDHVMQEKYMYIQRKCSISAHTISSIGRQRASCTRRLHPPTCTEEITLVSGKRKEKGPQPQSKQRTKQEESLELNQHLQPKSEVPVVCKLGDNARVVLRREVRSWQEDYQACFASIVLLRLVVVCCRCAGNMLVAARSDAVPLTNPLHVWIGVCSCDRGAGRPPPAAATALILLLLLIGSSSRYISSIVLGATVNCTRMLYTRGRRRVLATAAVVGGGCRVFFV